MPRRRDDLGLILEAARFAAQKHKEQRRKDAKATPYINHPLGLASILYEEGGVRDATVLAAALLHDTIEDTETTYQELRGHFGAAIADIVLEVTDTKFVRKQTRKRLQVSRAARASKRARLVKLADKISNLRDMLGHPPRDWSEARRREYFDWAKEVVDQARGVNPKLERAFDEMYRQKP